VSEDRLRYWTIGVMAIALALTLHLHLVPALLSGLLVHELVHALAPRIAFGGMARSSARLLTVGLIASVVIGALAGLTVLGVAFVRSEVAGPGNLMVRFADLIEQSREALPAVIRDQLPGDAESLRALAVGWTRGHAQQVQQLGKTVGVGIGHLFFGAVIGALICVREARGPEARMTPVAAQLAARLASLASVFRRVVFAQIKISAVNTALTATYLYLFLPAFGVHLPLRKTMIAVTFAAGLLPIIGNLISNTFIVVISLSVSVVTAAISLAFLLLLHKLEYFLNARIVGYQIKASAWELLCAMLVADAAFGVAGLVAAPIFYAYLKDELKAIGWL
jgi:predicted PurR-regulated permease PerM